MTDFPEDKRATEIQQIWQKWTDARDEWDDHAREDIDFYLGNHFSETEVDQLESRNQSNLTIDRLYSAIEQFKAIITSKPPKFSAVGREDSDTKMAQVWKVILEYIWDISDGNEVFKQVVHDYAITGLGYFYAYIDTEADYGRGEVKFNYIDPFRVAVDPNARNKWFDDASGICLSTILTKDQLLNLYPQLNEPAGENTEKLLIDIVNGMGLEDEDYPSPLNKRTKGSFTPDVVKDLDWDVDKYRLIEHFTKIKVPYYRILDKSTNQEQIFDSEKFQNFINNEELKPLFEKGRFDFAEVMQNRIKMTCTVGQIVLFERILDTDRYPIIPVPNIWTNTPYPMSDVRKGKDMQRFINKLLSLMTSHAQSSAGLKLLIPQGSVADIEQLEQDWANPNATIEYDASFGEPHFPSPQPLSSSIMQLPKLIEHYIDLNMGIFEMQQGNTEAAPRTSSGTMMMEDFGQRRSKSKLRDIEGSLKRLGQVIYNLSKSHYNFKKTFRIVQPNNDINEYTINKKLYDNKTQELQTIQNDINVGQFDIRVIGNSTMPSNKWGEWQVYMEAYKLGLIDRVEALKKTEIFDKSGVLQRMDEIAKLQSQLKGAQEQIKDLSGDLQTARRETVSSKQRAEVEKFKGRLKDNELGTKSKNQLSVDKLSNAVKLEQEKLRIRSQTRESNEKLQNKEK
tara:strand:- start:820 stop:2856 length:2037 start_codon:yes stop_codon:yes gene_type:complete